VQFVDRGARSGEEIPPAETGAYLQKVREAFSVAEEAIVKAAKKDLKL
jgi:hypothetical protein